MYKVSGYYVELMYCNSFRDYLTSIIMVNRSCDFCQNSYRKRPELGYFSVTPLIRQHLAISEESQRDFICSEHFAVECLDVKGRLVAGSLPTFFPQSLCKDHDHNYSSSTTLGPLDDSDDEGT